MLKRSEGPLRGSHRGHVPRDPSPPPPLPTVITTRPRRVGSGGKSVDQVVEDLIRAYARHARPPVTQIAKLDREEWRMRVRLLASDLVDENLSPDAFVGFIVTALKLRRQPAYVERVFPANLVAKEHPWLVSYRKSGAGIEAARGYRVTAARARAHDERARSAQVHQVLARFLTLWG